MTLGPFYIGDTPAADIEVHVQRDGTDVALDPYSAAEVLLYDAASDPVTWGSTPTVDTVDDVILITPPPTSPFATVGVYNMYLRLTATAGGTETFFATDIRVLQLGVAAGWARTTDVRNTTGETVTEDELALAQDVVELHCGRTYAGSSVNNSIRTKDLVWLRKAVCYQAAWMPNQPGYLNRHSFKEVNQDGAQIIYAGTSEPNNPALLMLAPLARRAIMNLSWMGSRSIKFKPPSFGGDHPHYGDYKRNDDHPGWRPM